MPLLSFANRGPVRAVLSAGLALAVAGYASSSCDGSEDASPASTQPRCGADGGLVLQVLGSGGPIADDARASTSYVLWKDGRARVMVDAGGGTFLRFGESGARIDDLDAIAITHLHADHVGGLPPLLKAGYFSARQEPLPLVGPTGNDRFPPIDDFLQGLIDPEDGPFQYLSGYLDGSLFPMPVSVVDAESITPTRVLELDDLTIDAVGVHHGTIPAVGYLVTIDGVRVAFAGDQSADNEPFIAMASDADVLVMHHAIPEDADNLAHLHATPRQIGETAAAARAGRLVLGHHMQRAISRADESVAAIGASFDGPIELSDDLSCYPLAP